MSTVDEPWENIYRQHEMGQILLINDHNKYKDNFSLKLGLFCKGKGLLRSIAELIFSYQRATKQIRATYLFLPEGFNLL